MVISVKKTKQAMLANYHENDYGKNECLLEVNMGAKKRMARGRETDCREYYTSADPHCSIQT
jgi:hypothetical protein